MKAHQTRLTSLAMVSALVSALPALGAAPSEKPAFPVKPLKIMVATAAGGGGGDAVARIVGRALTDVVKQQVVIENLSLIHI